VAEFVEMGAGGKVSTSQTPAGQQLSRWAYEQLITEFAGTIANVDLQIWHDSAELKRDNNVTLGFVADDPSSGSATPAQLAERLNADMVVYGVITPTQNGYAALAIKFYVTPQLNRDLSTVGGRYELENPIIFNLSDPGLEVKQQLNQQVSGLAQLTFGLTYGLLGESPKAIEALQKARTALPESEIVQFLLGQEYLFLAQKEPANQDQNEQLAQQVFEQAIKFNPSYVRAYIGLGSVFFQRAQRRLADTYSNGFSGNAEEAYRATLELIEPGIQNYQRAIEQYDRPQAYGVPLDSIAQTALGQSYRLKGEAYYRLGDAQSAQQWIDRAGDAFKKALPPLNDTRDYRLIAQAYQGLGNVYYWQGFINNDDQAAYQQAIAAYEKCIQQGELFPVDKFLTNVVVAQYCKPQRDDLKARIGGGQ